MNPVRIDNPTMPLWHSIPNLDVGHVINIKGIFPSTMQPESFSQLNLCHNTKEMIALHVSIRFNQHHVVRNSRRNGDWEKEEKAGPFPFQIGSQFWMQIVVQQHAYQISVNGQECWTFAHRLPFRNVNIISMEGAFQIFNAECVNPSSMPGGCLPPFPRPNFIPGTCQPPPAYPGRNPYQIGGTNLPLTPFLEPVYNPPIPYNQIISGGIQPGMMFYISGAPRPNYQKFTVNLQCGSAPYPLPDIAFHFDVRPSNMTVVRNTRRDNQWGNEELTAPNFPFIPNVPFDMMILVQNDKYLVAINGQHFIEYPHRIMRFAMINTLLIENDIDVKSIRFAR